MVDEAEVSKWLESRWPCSSPRTRKEKTEIIMAWEGRKRCEEFGEQSEKRSSDAKGANTDGTAAEACEGVRAGVDGDTESALRARIAILEAACESVERQCKCVCFPPPGKNKYHQLMCRGYIAEELARARNGTA